MSPSRLDAEALQETIYRLDGPLRWALGENLQLADRASLQAGDHALDIGAGTGYLTLPVAARVGDGGSVTCLDPSPELLGVLQEKARSAGLDRRLRCVAGVAEAMRFASDSFDAVVCSYLLHELDEPQAALDEMFRVLRPGGRFVLADYRRLEDAVQQRRIEAWYGAQDDGAGPDEVHLRFTLAEVEQMLLRAGFSAIELATWAEFHVHAAARK